jgi:soluble lytic murein transglycosylase
MVNAPRPAPGAGLAIRLWYEFSMAKFMPRASSPILSVLFALLCGATSTLGFADPSSDLPRQRARFLAAEAALHRGDPTEFRTAIESLRNYPLFPYLRYEYLAPRIGRVDDSEIIDFVNRYAGSPLGVKLHLAWMQVLANRREWSKLLRYYPSYAENTELDCYRRRALYHTGERSRALEGVEELWLTANAHPAACDEVFVLWQRTGALTPDLAWKRFALAMQANEISVARRLMRYMDAGHRDWANTWLQIHADPQAVVSAIRQRPPKRAPDRVLAYGIKRMAYSNTNAALKLWDGVRESSDFNAETRAELERSLALALAVRGHPQALDRIWAINDVGSDPSIREWRTRLSLAREDWEAVLKSIYAMPESERETPDWRYWQARALDALGQRQQAEEIYLDLAIGRGYYSFLAADHLARPYQLGHTPLSPSDAAAVTTEAYPGLARARELYFLDRLADARREWYFTTRNMTDWQLHAAASLAQSWGWYDRAILTLAHSEIRDDLDVRFPLAYRESIVAQAEAHGVDPALAFALVRQESAFATDARSPAGALGLTQLMPATARRLAKYLHLRLDHRTSVMDITTNLRLGMAYLRQMLDRYDHQLPALAAYNAGQQRVDKWLPREGAVPADVWTDTVPLRETRNYVQNIMAFSVIYQQRMELPEGKLAQRMPPVGPRNFRTARGDAGARQGTSPQGPTDASS